MRVVADLCEEQEHGPGVLLAEGKETHLELFECKGNTLV